MNSAELSEREVEPLNEQGVWRFDPEGEKLGLALSGGGHRATLFGLGALIYLFDAGANRNIGSISSVSGGSILNAYLSLLSPSLTEMTTEEFQDAASAIASMISGSKLHWRLAMLLSGLSALSLSVGIVFGVLLPVIAACGLAIVAILVGRKSGGSLWTWAGSWIYVLVLMAIFSLSILSFCELLRTGERGLLVVATVIAFAYLIRRRDIVAEFAFEHSVCQLSRSTSEAAKLTDINNDVDYIFCATEMHAGQHFYFTRDFVYFPGVGVGGSQDVRVSTAIQASAAFPGAFPIRKINSSLFNFCVWDTVQLRDGPTEEYNQETKDALFPIKGVPTSVLLTDGGVHDNLGVSWSLLGEKRARGLESWLWYIRDRAKRLEKRNPTYQWNGSIEKRLGVRAFQSLLRSQNVTIAINAGMPLPWRERFLTWLPVLSEIVLLNGAMNIMYSTLQRSTIDLLRFKFDSGELRGSVVDMTEVGIRAGKSRDRSPLDWRMDEYIESLDEPREILIALHTLSERNSRVKTTLNPLGRDIVVDLIQHGYIEAMTSLHVRLGLELFDFPNRERFESLIRS